MYDCYCEWDTGISNFEGWDSGTNHLNTLRTRKPVDEKNWSTWKSKKKSSLPCSSFYVIVVHLLQGSTLHGIKLHKKLWKCSQRRLEGDNLEGGVLFNKFKVLVSCTQMCHDPVSHTGNQMLSPVPIAPQNTQKMRDWVQTFGVAARQMAKAGTLLSYLNQREIWLGEPVSFKLSHFEEQQKKKKKTPAVTRNQMSHFQMMRLHVMIVTLSLEWETHFIHRRFFPHRKKCLLQ